MAIQKAWTAHLKNKEDQERFKTSLKEAQRILKVLSSIIDSFIEQNDKDRLKKDMYSRPNWAIEQADLVGETRAYKKVQDFLRKSLT